MFTGIVQALGRVAEIGPDYVRVTPPSDFAVDGYDQGESIAVNGCCLTVIERPDDSSKVHSDTVTFDVSPETWRRTSLADLRPGSPVNLERAMVANGRFGGHIVQGHVDATGTIVAKEPSGEFVIVRIECPTEFDRYLIDKGSITVDGISLTVVDPKDGAFDLWIIPHTLAHTNLHSKDVGDPVNLEFDVIAKYVEKLLAK